MSYQSSESLHKDPEATQFHSELHTLINAFGDAVISVDRDGRFVLWNPGAERLFGYTSTEALGESLDLIIPPQTRKAHNLHDKCHCAGQGCRIGSEVVLEHLLNAFTSLMRINRDDSCHQID